MSIKFFGGRHVVWQRLRKAFGSGRKAQVAVAFLGQGAFMRMPLAAGSTLVVNASLETVRSGQTDPRELLKYVRAGVHVFTRANLHAKVYVVGRSCFIGSANVSSTSEQRLVESIMVCSDSAVVRKSRQFVVDHAIERLGPEALKQLTTHYRPPKLLVHGAKQSKTKSRESDPPLAVSLITKDWTDEGNAADRKGEPIAKKQLRNSRDFRIEKFDYTGTQNISRLSKGRYIYEVVKEGRIKRLHPGGRIIHVEPFSESGRPAAIIYVELPRNKKARRLNSLPAEIRETILMLKSLRTIREIRNAKHAAALAQLFI